MDHPQNNKRNKRLEHKKKVEQADANVKMDVKFNYFTYKEFDQPGIPGSGKANMDINLLMIVDNMRHRSGIPYKINSGFRDTEYNRSIGGVENSAHCVGKE